MNIQLAFLLMFVAGGLSVWVLMRMSKQVKRERMDVIKKKISSIGGRVLGIELINKDNCPFSSEYQDPDIVYKFYKVVYTLQHQSKKCWAILEMKQNSYGPSSAMHTTWVWRDLA